MFSPDQLYRRVRELIKGEVKRDEPLARHTTFGIGGPADVWALPESLEDLCQLVSFSQREKVPILIMGAGSNLLVSDRGVTGIVISLGSPEFCLLRIEDNKMVVGAGTKLPQFLQVAASAGLGGAEFLSGIPGTVGGALVTNAGAKDFNGDSQRTISEIVSLISVVSKDSGAAVKRLTAPEASFGWRNSKLGQHVVYEAKFRLFRKNEAEISRKIARLLASRKRKQDLDWPSAGCIFKNPQDLSFASGQLIEKSGFAGRCLGGAQVSRRHANFIINRGSATARDVYQLMRKIQKRVKQDHGIWLEPEIRLVGDFN